MTTWVLVLVIFSNSFSAAPASTYRYRVTFNPTVIIPDDRMNTTN